MSTKLKPTDFNTSYKPTWCPGCGDFGIWTAIKTALAELGIMPHDVVIVYGIGCSGNMANTIKCYGFHTLHGRTLPVALGAKLANKNLTVLAVAGDGDCYGEGTNHFIHTARYNADINLIVCNNQTFSLTTGQSSPTSDLGRVTKTTLWGEIKQPVNPMTLSLSAGSSFVARSAAFELKHLTNLIKSAIKHKGFSHIDVLQQCVTFNKLNTVAWYKERMYEIEKAHNQNNLKSAFDKALEKDKLPIGLFYQNTDLPRYTDGFEQMKDGILIEKEVRFDKELLKEFE